jgi:hypothetical protein
MSPMVTDPIDCFFKHVSDLFIANGIRLQCEEARDHLEVVLHPVVNLFQQCLLFDQGGGKTLVCLPALCFIPHHLGKSAQLAGVVVDSRGDSPAPEAATVFPYMPALILCSADGRSLAHPPFWLSARHVFRDEENRARSSDDLRLCVAEYALRSRSSQSNFNKPSTRTAKSEQARLALEQHVAVHRC